MLPEAVAAVTAAMAEPGNASSLHAAGRDAPARARSPARQWPQALGARPSEVLFTGGGTESDNLAVKGLFWARRAADPRRTAHPGERRRAPRRSRRGSVARRARGRRGHLAACRHDRPGAPGGARGRH